MEKQTNNSDFFYTLQQELADVKQTFIDFWDGISVWLRNQIRRAQQAKIDYILMPIGGPMPERSEPPRSFIQRHLPLPPAPLSMEKLNRRFRAIGDAANVKGVVLVFRGFDCGLASLQNLRRAIHRLRATGKEVIVYTPYLDTPHYYVATAADRIIVPPGTMFEVLGVRTGAIFLKDALAQVGIQADIVQISPYKTAGNIFGESDITPEQQEQLTWLLEERYDMITEGMANGRSLSQTDMQALIDTAPLFAEDALKAGLIDHIAYEDELAYLLADPPSLDNNTNSQHTETRPETDHESEQPKAKLLTWAKAWPQLMEKHRRHTPKIIAVVSLEGTIVMGPSRQPPVDLPLPLVGGPSAGEQTILRLLRQVEKQKNVAALIFHVDSPGGSALASDLIAREINRVAQKIPVLVYMGNVAASGGYYVSAPASHIMCQRGTITGSIGVINGRISTAGMYQKLHINRVYLERGRHASLYTSDKPMTEEERQIFWNAIVKTYDQFKNIVANGRQLPYEELDPICEGRVWSGRQARMHKLVDSHGDFVDAVRKAAELAGLPADDDHEVPVVNFYPQTNRYMPPQPFSAKEEIQRWVLGDLLTSWNNQPLLLMPFVFKLE
ncbi:MAG: signal peptide peptidase SppA [Chloroflexi bacterium]|nr:MAG: signal peptide peptidase SppA [Chloroflexota bacterium]